MAGARASEWLRSEAAKHRPFYLHVGFWETHRPFCGTEFQEEAARRIDREALEVPGYLPDTPPARAELAELHQSVSRVDAAVGKILQALEEAKLDSDTLVLFTADHGLPFPRAKGTLYDPGIQVALMVRGGQAKAGARVRDLTANVDMMPTLLQAAGLPVPERVQGQSFLGALGGDAAKRAAREAVYAEKTYHEHYDPMRCLRTNRHKYIHNFADRPMLVLPSDIYNSPTRQSILDDESIWAHRPQEELYDIARDPLEQDNLALQPQYADQCAAFKQQLHEWMRATGDPLLAGAIPRKAQGPRE